MKIHKILDRVDAIKLPLCHAHLIGDYLYATDSHVAVKVKLSDQFEIIDKRTNKGEYRIIYRDQIKSLARKGILRLIINDTTISVVTKKETFMLKLQEPILNDNMIVLLKRYFEQVSVEVTKINNLENVNLDFKLVSLMVDCFNETVFDGHFMHKVEKCSHIAFFPEKSGYYNYDNMGIIMPKIGLELIFKQD